MTAFEELVTVNGVALWTATQGAGPPVVLCHGGPGIYDYLEPVAAMLEDLATVHRYDQRGCGRSDDRRPYDVATFIDDLDALRAHWGYEAWTVLGHSWGAALALLYAARCPERTERLVYISGTGIDPAWHDEYRSAREVKLQTAERDRLRRLEEERTVVIGADLDRLNAERATLLEATEYYDATRFEELPRYDRFPVNYTLNAALNAEMNGLEDSGALPAQVARIAASTLVLDGEGDPRPRWARAQVADLIPDARHLTIERAGHDPWVEQPDVTAAALRGFLVDTG
ncbi:MAG: alpha/beta fold hydrolase [Chloroflexota bacterium]|nr:alpha/beta fold hydrolase [Chloroflexota bacterium]